MPFFPSADGDGASGRLQGPGARFRSRGPVEEVSLAADARPRVQILERAASSDEGSIADAERLVVVGRGIGGKKNLKLVREFAAAIGAEIGCTRPVVEAGWLEYRHQVGQTGVSVAPKLLVSLGVSGAIQHLAGISGAECVVAVNEDPDAPILGAAQYSVVGDCVEFMRAYLRRREGGSC